VVSSFNERTLSGQKFWNSFYDYLNQNYKILFTEKIDSYYWGIVLFMFQNNRKKAVIRLTTNLMSVITV